VWSASIAPQSSVSITTDARVRIGTLEDAPQPFPSQVEGNREHQETNHDRDDQADSRIEVERP
jgi:hypothetical protein